MTKTSERSFASLAEMMPSPSPALSIEQELRQCREELQAARTAQHHFQVFSERVTDYAFITFDPENRITSWSRGAERILGYPEAEILGQVGNIFFTPEDRAACEFEKELATAECEGCAEDERWHLRRDGSRFWGSGVMTAHRDSHGHLEAYSKILRDLTARRQLEEKLRESEERFRLFSDNVQDYALVPVDTDVKCPDGTRERREHLATGNRRSSASPSEAMPGIDVRPALYDVYLDTVLPRLEMLCSGEPPGLAKAVRDGWHTLVGADPGNPNRVLHRQFPFAAQGTERAVTPVHRT